MRRGNLTDLVSELERQKRNSRDIVVQSNNLVAVNDGLGVRLAVNAGAEVVEEYPLTEFAHRQLSAKMGIPQKYYDRMREEKQNELLAHNINTWMSVKEKRLVRVLDGKVRAILSDKYRPIDNYDLVWSFLDAANAFTEKNGTEPIRITQCDVTESRMYLRAMMPAETAMLAMRGDYDKVQAMVLLTNSEVGAGRMAVSLGMWRQICSNGMWGDDIVERVHIGGKLAEGVIEWSAQTLKDTDVALFDQVRDTITTAMKPELWSAYVKSIENSAQTPLDQSIVEVIDAVSPKYNITAEEKEKLLNCFIDEVSTVAGRTQWGLANAMTRLGRDTEDADRQVELEHIGFEIASANESELNTILKKVTV